MLCRLCRVRPLALGCYNAPHKASIVAAVIIIAALIIILWRFFYTEIGLTLKKPKIILPGEHTAALDPKTAAKVLEITNKLVTENELTALMITHNMHDPIKYGNRLIMMDQGKVVVDVSGEEKKEPEHRSAFGLFESASGSKMLSDKLMLSKK